MSEIDPTRTAVVIIDPQNDFLSEGGVVWDLVGEGVKSTKVVEHLVALRDAAKQAGIPVLYCPHYYSDQEFASWKHLNPIDKLMFDRKMFRTPGWGSEFHPDLVPDENTFVLAPHKALSGFWAGDIALQQGDTANRHIAWSLRRGGQWYLTTPIFYRDLLYTCSNNGILACYNPKTGERVYHERIGGKGNSYTASPIAADGKLYFTSQDGEIFVVKAGPKYELLATNPMGEVSMATPAISERMIFVRTEKHLYGIGKPKE